MMSRKIRVLVADDHERVRKSICSLIETQADMEVVATAENGQEAIHLTRQVQPDVVVIDIYMPLLDGMEATNQIRANNKLVSIVILSMHISHTLIEKAMQLGAQGYVWKRYAMQDLPQAVRAAQQGKTFLSPAIANTVKELFNRSSANETPNNGRNKKNNP